ncbi:nuclear transport factor 2 family protein [Paracoccus xiamenensis]|uniref:nuclear transport factor 2 family protein n=1 Tax=Paracoccus xiamenensis TaxID=2714901 RepID=UPI001407CF49|nr:nuclear transport factor 2 family protein [Paracoccus xiamenensis]NHF73823.1 nuclear transport factor 2 family protein [Paracoccus xiamenensis]
MSDDLWRQEEIWWTMGAAEAARRMAPNCVMVLSGEILQGEDILARLSQGPRWDSVTMLDRHMAESGDMAVLAYRAEASRATGAETRRRVLCSSNWIRLDGWRLICHQQMPI